MEDGAIGDKLGNVAVSVSNSWGEIATSRHQDPEEDLVQDPRQKKVNAGWYFLSFIYIIKIFLSKFCSLSYWNFELLHFEAACGNDFIPRDFKIHCKKFSCVKLARTKKCGKRFNEAVPKWCSNKLTKWYQAQQVKNHCKRSCKNCGKIEINNLLSYWNQHPNIDFCLPTFLT